MVPCRSAVIEAVLYSSEGGVPNLPGLRVVMRAARRHRLLVFAFDLLNRNGVDLRRLPLIDRRIRLLGTISRSRVPILHVLPCFDETTELVEAMARYEIDGIISKRRVAPYRSGHCHDWVKVEITHSPNQDRILHGHAVLRERAHRTLPNC
jgi:bifunctional non-homologous end joining protein LigD